MEPNKRNILRPSSAQRKFTIHKVNNPKAIQQVVQSLLIGFTNKEMMGEDEYVHEMDFPDKKYLEIISSQKASIYPWNCIGLLVGKTQYG